MNNNNFSVLPFYKDINEQSHRRSYAYGDVYPLLCPLKRILPFQIIQPRTTATPSQIFIVDFASGVETDITSQMSATGYVDDVQCGNYYIITYQSLADLTANIPQGRYYLHIKSTYNFGEEHYYSEVFTFTPDVSALIKIEWWDRDNFVFDDGAIVYKYSNNTVKQCLYIAAELGKPDYVFEEEGENRDGYFFAEKQLSEKVYHFTMTAPEYLCDLMRFIRLADFVYVYDQYGHTYKCDTFLITPKWLTQGDLAQVDCEFETNTVAKRVGQIIAE